MGKWLNALKGLLYRERINPQREQASCPVVSKANKYYEAQEGGRVLVQEPFESGNE